MWDYNHLEERDNWENTVVLPAEDQETVSVAAELDVEFLSFFCYRDTWNSLYHKIQSYHLRAVDY